MLNAKGFSLIELLIVVAIILIIAAIAIPNLLQARIAANEASAVGSVRAIKTAEYAYYSTYPTVGYSNTLVELGGANPCVPAPATSCIIDNFLAQSGVGSFGKSGYVFTATGIATGGSAINNAFVAAAAPVTYSKSGNRLFCSTDDGVLRTDPGSASPPVTTTAACLAYPVAQ
jgi:type IV pilus assembly protein PilA